MRIILRRLPDGNVANERVVVSVQDRMPRFSFQAEIRKRVQPGLARTFIDTLLGEQGRAIVARINRRLSEAKRPAVRRGE